MSEQPNTNNQASAVGLRNFCWRWLPVLVWMIVIFLLSHQPNSSHATEHVFGTLNLLARKIAHVSEYAALFLLTNRALGGKRLTALLISIAYAASDEWHQMFVPGRSPSVSDVGIDTIGMLLAWIILRLMPKKNS